MSLQSYIDEHVNDHDGVPRRVITLKGIGGTATLPTDTRLCLISPSAPVDLFCEGVNGEVMVSNAPKLKIDGVNYGIIKLENIDDVEIINAGFCKVIIGNCKNIKIMGLHNSSVTIQDSEIMTIDRVVTSLKGSIRTTTFIGESTIRNSGFTLDSCNFSAPITFEGSEIYSTNCTHSAVATFDTTRATCLAIKSTSTTTLIGSIVTMGDSSYQGNFVCTDSEIETYNTTFESELILSNSSGALQLGDVKTKLTATSSQLGLSNLTLSGGLTAISSDTIIDTCTLNGVVAITNGGHNWGGSTFSSAVTGGGAIEITQCTFSSGYTHNSGTIVAIDCVCTGNFSGNDLKGFNKIHKGTFNDSVSLISQIGVFSGVEIRQSTVAHACDLKNFSESSVYYSNATTGSVIGIGSILTMQNTTGDFNIASCNASIINCSGALTVMGGSSNASNCVQITLNGGILNATDTDTVVATSGVIVTNNCGSVISSGATLKIENTPNSVVNIQNEGGTNLVNINPDY